jgi:hypothetical protein
MAELADALDSGSSDRKVMQVQVLFLAPEEASAMGLSSFSWKFGNAVS